MTSGIYRFEFTEDVDLEEAEKTLHLAILAAEGIFGPAWVRLDAGYQRDTGRRTIVVDGRTSVGEVVVSVFTSFLTREFGEMAFRVGRVPQEAVVQGVNPA